MGSMSSFMAGSSSCICPARAISKIPRHKNRKFSGIKRNRSSTCFFGFPEVAAREILLHHILIQSGHYDHNKDTTEELFEEVLPGNPVVKYKNTAVFAVALDGFRMKCREILSQFLNGEIDDKDQCGIRQNVCRVSVHTMVFDSTFMSIYPYQGNGADSNQPKGTCIS